ncbi:hypothetical protein P0Y35_17370 [Kiritimatiellaeota bacterium B1221]|nr:hypothetical protein [Kiritimatiellaeota bacterium B1221]
MKMKKTNTTLMAFLVFLATLFTVGCDEVEDSAENAADTIEDAAEDAVDATKDGMDNIGDAAEDAADEVDQEM